MICISSYSCLQTYSIAVQHANKMEISALKSMGAVGGKAGRSALFSASDVCRMFEHWKAHVPLVLRQLAEGKVRKEEVKEEWILVHVLYAASPIIYSTRTCVQYTTVCVQ